MTEAERKKAFERRRRTEKYAEKVKSLFSIAIDDLLNLVKKIPDINGGEMYSFDAECEDRRYEIEKVFRRLAASVRLAIIKGIENEWKISNEETDKMLQTKFGKWIFNNKNFAGVLDRGAKAMDAFINRSDRGMNLSDRIWKYSRQFRDEMEVALTVGIGEGKSAKSLSRDIRKYLNDPDLMFRRFKYKIAEKEILDEDGNVVGTEKIYGRKWKKRSVDSKGKVTWDDCDPKSYETGAGVYKSAYKNAMRVARTETNMAYRHADNERWGNLDFVLGQEIELSRNHPKEDICDELAGKYPKDFVFSGWHPQCFCHATAITASAEEMKKWIEARNAGEEYEFEGRITDVPEVFKRWIGDNRDKLRAGKVPYFVKENQGIVDKIYYIEECRDKFNAYDEKEWRKTYFDEKTGGFNVYHKNHQFSEVKIKGSSMTGGDAERYVGMLLARQGKQVEFLEESGIGGKNADFRFDDETWDVKYIDTANENTIRKYLKDARKAQNVIFFYTMKEEDVIREIVQSAYNREMGRLKALGKTPSVLPKIHIIKKEG